MSWIKRNLYFLLCTLVALGLMGYGGFRLYNAFTNEKDVSDKIQAQYVELDRLKKQNPHPGSSASGKVDNVKAAKDQEALLRDFIAKARRVFVRPTPIPDNPKASDKEFKTELSTTIAQLTRQARDASVTLPAADYYFTFEAQRKVLQFDAGSLEPLASHLGEIKAICDVLFAAKINSLVGIQRETISAMDQNQTGSDYLTDKTMSTPLGDLTPYRVVFQCFSAELAQVLSGLANSPHGFIVKTINVDPAEITTDVADTTAPGTPVVMNQAAIDNRNKNRYRDSRYASPPPMVAPQPTTAPAASKPTVLVNEHQVKVTLMVEVIKLKAETVPVKPEAGKTKAK